MNLIPGKTYLIDDIFCGLRQLKFVKTRHKNCNVFCDSRNVALAYSDLEVASAVLLGHENFRVGGV